MASMAFTVLPRVTAGGLMILVHPDKPPDDADFNKYFDELVRHDPERLRTLVFTDGGAPSESQRKRINDFLRGRSSLCAVVTSNTFVRAVVTALSWFNPKIKALSPKHTREAMAYLGIPDGDHIFVRHELRSLQRQLDVRVASIAAVSGLET